MVRHSTGEMLRGQPTYRMRNGTFRRRCLFIEWKAVSESAQMNDGIGTFVFTDEGIRAQTVRYTLEARK
ncbi:hypothetical protein GCM10023215_46820 [Pseudonocardia yuanmonensis]|uniref:Uncharacterized protein n=2 Tax=Pseudonocardia yuanmonensis TaxID=1095914 RepID=A0ABP8X7D6_9PSEU